MPINTGLHVGAALNDKNRLNKHSNIIDPLHGNTAFNQGEFGKDAYLGEQ